MKKNFLILSMVLLSLMALAISSNALTNNYSANQNKNIFEPCAIIFSPSISKPYSINFSPSLQVGSCIIRVRGYVTFNWNGPGTLPTNVTGTITSISIVCGGNTKTSPIPTLNSLNWNSSTGQFDSINFNATGDSQIDSIFSDNTVLNAILAEINSGL